MRRSYSNTEPSGQINITWNPDIEAYETSFPYKAEFITWIKAAIPVNKRTMDYDSSRNPKYKWMFEEKTLETVILPTMRVMFPRCAFKILTKVEVDEYNKGFVPPKAPIDSNAWKQEFRQLVTAAGIDTSLPDKKQYYKAAMYYHPDRNPDLAAKMSRLNEIWSTVFEPKEVVLV